MKKNSGLGIVAFVMLVLMVVVVSYLGYEQGWHTLISLWLARHASLVYALCVTCVVMFGLATIVARRKEKEKSSALKFYGTLLVVFMLLVAISFNYFRNQNSLYGENTKYDDNETIKIADDLPPITIVGDLSVEEKSYFIDECIKPQPYELLKETTRIFLCSREQFEEIRKENDIAQAVAFAVPTNRHIYIDASRVGMYRVVTHELSHNYDVSHDFISETKKFKKEFEDFTKDEQFNGLFNLLDVQYARSSAAEFFAEVSDTYFNQGQELERRFPELYTYFDDIYNGENL
ncbi:MULTISPECIES: zinc-dependent peptidase [unclassified Breznakia]|uniref:zinc-dependent peptidase n=1 Tax=unclassified Breznakia TaxID=2623764 RepID=UPI002475A21B|nr:MULTISPECIES: zinc-dependent peptidase [unclassified Breznakia]MDH6367281.1 hypothetical protein [Breznakia sp. PH1-1]MDH6404460.1 hypothetical protein [Breznakia sp. PF1-11]MDH6412149.1 hypothetical protein [Breznakia sp. PFB1-11]MDH6414448.1 hypothetical protein [Breznakia sp. PFB1-14]MDH6416833.1 hypothetical protein [Breznakia sp. PFB1-4]